MQARILDYGPHTMEFVDVLNTRLERQVLLQPFAKSTVQKAVVEAGRLYCVSAARSTQNAQLAIFDAMTGKELSRRSATNIGREFTILPKNNMLAVTHQATIKFYKLDTLELHWETTPRYHIDDATTFTQVTDPSGPAYETEICVSGTLFETADGTIRSFTQAGMNKSHGENSLLKATGILEYDVTQREHQFRPTEVSTCGDVLPLISASPDGRFALRETPTIEIGKQHPHPSDKAKWFLEHQKLDLWDLDNGTPVKRFDIATMPFAIYPGIHTSDEWLHRYQAYTTWCQTTENQFFFPSQPPATLQSNRNVLEFHSTRANVKGKHRTDVFWEPNGQAFWVKRRSSLRRIALHGHSGPLLFLDAYLNDENRAILGNRDPGTDIGIGETYPIAETIYLQGVETHDDQVRLKLWNGFIDLPLKLVSDDQPRRVLVASQTELQKFPPLIAQDVAHLLSGLVPCQGWDKAHVTTCIHNLKTKIETDLDGLTTSTRGIGRNIQNDETYLDEGEIGDPRMVRNILIWLHTKRLLDQWATELREKEISFGGHSTKAAGPLSGALNYLVMQTMDCVDQLRNYIVCRDGEHEIWSRDHVLRGYLERANFSHDNAWRLAILEVLLHARDGSGFGENGQQVSTWKYMGVLDAARERITPQKFAGLLLEEIEYLDKQPDVFAAFGTHPKSNSEALRDLRNNMTHQDWDKTVTAELSAVLDDRWDNRL